MLHPNILRDALENMNPATKSDPQYAKGILLGVISTLMAQGKDFDEAAAIAKEHMPAAFYPESVPPCWMETIPTPEPPFGTVAHWLHEMDNCHQVTAVQVTIGGQTFPAGKYLNQSKEWCLYIVCPDPINTFVKRKARFVEAHGAIWFVAGFIPHYDITTQNETFHPFGANCILQRISADMAEKIELSQKIVGISIT